jgi:hypothetical protein
MKVETIFLADAVFGSTPRPASRCDSLIKPAADDKLGYSMPNWSRKASPARWNLRRLANPRVREAAYDAARKKFCRSRPSV